VTVPTLDRRRERALRDPALARVWASARAKVEAKGGVVGTVRLPALSGAEALALDGLWNPRARRRPRRDQPFALPLRDLDASLREAVGLGLVDVLALLGAPLELAPLRRAQQHAAVEAARRETCAHPLCLREPAVAGWAQREWASGTLARTARGRERELLLAALELGMRLPADPPVERTRLAAEALQGDPHALDDDQPLARLVLRQLAARAGSALPEGAGERRELWRRFGVLVDALSADALVLALRPRGDGPLARALHALHPGHARITLAQLQREPLTFPREQDVFLCENPAVIAAAERLPAPPPMVCTGGWPTSAVCALLDRLRDAGARLRHHGDFDWEGVRISAWLAERYGVRPWRYDATTYRRDVAAHAARARPLQGRPGAGDRELLAAMAEVGRELHEEAVLDDLLADLREAGRGTAPSA
jgi:uncharacterized protein (TIGR02679 family)